MSSSSRFHAWRFFDILDSNVWPRLYHPRMIQKLTFSFRRLNRLLYIGKVPLASNPSICERKIWRDIDWEMSSIHRIVLIEIKIDLASRGGIIWDIRRISPRISEFQRLIRPAWRRMYHTLMFVITFSKPPDVQSRKVTALGPKLYISCFGPFGISNRPSTNKRRPGGGGGCGAPGPPPPGSHVGSLLVV